MKKNNSTYTCKHSAIDAVETGKRIKNCMKEKRIPISELANSIGVSGQSVYKWINGQSTPTLENMFQISLILKTTIDELIVGKTNVEYDVPDLYVRDIIDAAVLVLR